MQGLGQFGNCYRSHSHESIGRRWFARVTRKAVAGIDAPDHHINCFDRFYIRKDNGSAAPEEEGTYQHEVMSIQFVLTLNRFHKVLNDPASQIWGAFGPADEFGFGMCSYHRFFGP